MKVANCAFAILVFGELGESARISLKTILNIHDSRICVSGDLLGINWLKRELSSKQFNQLCIHQIPHEELKKLGLIPATYFIYSNFGNERFVKLTTFKWYLLSDVLKKHSHIDYVIFTDLDVYWFKAPEANFLASEKFKSTLAAIQDDTPRNASISHFCTGIMFWKNSITSIKILDLLYSTQMRKNLEGKLIPDEPTFNIWYQNSEDKEKINSLTPDQFVIGHRFFHLVLSMGFRISNATAFHANYVVGEKNKETRLLAMKFRQNQNMTWIPILFLEILKKFFSKINNYRF